MAAFANPIDARLKDSARRAACLAAVEEFDGLLHRMDAMPK